MNILGIQAFFYNHAAALLSGGRISFFCEEEKLDRTKGLRDGFPFQGIEAALRRENIDLGGVDEIVYAWEPWRYTRSLMRGAAVALWQGITSPRAAGRGPRPVSINPDRIASTLRLTPPFLRGLIRQQLRHGGIVGAIPDVHFVRHHTAHAAGAFYPSGFEEATVVVADGMGELECTTSWRGRGLGITPLDSVAFPNSLGEFYAAFTEYAGFRTYSEEGKLMGLAAYGGPDPEIQAKMDQVMRVDADGYQLDPRFTVWGSHDHGHAYSDQLVELFGPPRHRNDELTDLHRAIAWAAQDRLEAAALGVVRRAVRRSGIRKVCFSGGVAMNCKLNGAILHSGEVDDLFVLPASNDAGAALGATMVRARAHGEDPRFALEDVYTGPEASEAEIEASILNAKVPYRRLEEKDYAEIAEMLVAGQVLALYTGRNEFGARALGARSIIADSRRAEMIDVVNGSVKHRENWRPFAPVILEGFEEEYFENGRPSRFMMKAFQVRPEKRDSIPAVVHVDGTCRPQSIRRETNAPYYDILDAFHQRTGVPVLMNTSFNVRGEAIVSRPVEALRCYLGTGLDALVIGPFLLRKQGL